MTKKNPRKPRQKPSQKTVSRGKKNSKKTRTPVSKVKGFGNFLQRKYSQED